MARIINLASVETELAKLATGRGHEMGLWKENERGYSLCLCRTCSYGIQVWEDGPYLGLEDEYHYWTFGGSALYRDCKERAKAVGQ